MTIYDPQYHKAWYALNREKRVKQQAKRKAENTARVRAIKASKPCTDCGKYYPPVCMDFDHTEDNKIGSISNLINYRWSRIEQEILASAN